MFDGSAEFYDLIYSGFKDYARETEQIIALLRHEHPHGRTVLDVACGTGAHARLLAAHGYIVDGLDLNPAFVAIPQAKHPEGQFFTADMRDFCLPNRYDAVLCLFSSIGYACTLDGVAQTLECFRQHLAANGIIVVEPWFAPDVLDPTRVATNSGETGGLRVTRVSRVEIAGRVSRLYFDYEITEGTQVRKVSEVHELGLFTRPEMIAAFRQAGLEATYDAEGLNGRGLYVARVEKNAS